LLRKIDTLLDLSALRESFSPFYSHTGRPSINPEVMLPMLIVGYCYDIRSERRLCEEVHFNLAYRWFCRLRLEGVAQTPAYRQSCRQRKKVEMLFAQMKRILKLDRLRLRGMSGAHGEFLLGQPLRKICAE